ncbi:uncharacterized protein LAESUDRAFT_646581 [Laetiporus sulphureus 93-53]|uniref:Uncharacterized protein n=1 Tax=Laetiporus sulphureus 93-53 TaxID=1314785 RepID=A0A165G2R2_9APHY|nr:uncharacterized protein LAESUDRAFT_646581 [Laetiporus sulphureus 93-53]KZT09751.1 hypothetical protein LAESUDRAFT_646581 [Laetiporus sulphureus 93-53]
MHLCLVGSRRIPLDLLILLKKVCISYYPSLTAWLHPFNVAAHTAAVNNARSAPSPSIVANSVTEFERAQEDHPIYNGRPVTHRASPIALYNDAFARLTDKDILHNLSVADSDNVRAPTTAKLFLAATDIYDTEKERETAIFDYIEYLLEVKLERHVKMTTAEHSDERDAFARVPLGNSTFGEKKGVFLCVQVKNELGMGGNGGLQGALTSMLTNAQYREIRNASCCPCIILSIVGPYICFFGAVLVDIFIVQPLTDYIYLGGDPFMNDRIFHVANLLGVLADAVKNLRNYYRLLSPNNKPQRARLFPNPTYIEKHEHPVGPLHFIKRFNDGENNYRRSLFHAKLDGKPVLVKFCEEYNGHAHRHLAAIGLAPKLHFCSKICGRVTTVIMDFVEGEDAHSKYGEKALPLNVLDDVKRAVNELHIEKAGHAVNTKSGQEEVAGVSIGALLVDFDLAGVDGQARYPALLNEEIDWVDGVAPMAVMSKEHDLGMLKKLGQRGGPELPGQSSPQS